MDSFIYQELNSQMARTLSKKKKKKKKKKLKKNMNKEAA